LRDLESDGVKHQMKRRFPVSLGPCELFFAILPA
jgi:hypothetical protein